MANPFYAPGEQRAAKVNDLFATVARRYDFLNDLQSLGLHRRWKRRVADLAVRRPGELALDLCCGTGDIAHALAARGAQVTGLDFSEPMLNLARQRLPHGQGHNVPPPRFVQGDALQLPFSDAAFDIVTVGYGLRNLADWELGLREMIRVAKPGARLLVLDFGKPNNALWRTLYFGYLAAAVPLLGKLFCGNAPAYAYILESLQNYPAQQGVAVKMQELALRQVRIENILGGVMSIHYAEKP